MLTGRDLMKSIKNKEKFVIATKLLTDSSGKKMGKTEGNMVSLDQTAEDIFGKVMSWGDNLIIPGFEIITDVSLDEVNKIKSEIESGSNPKEFKMRLAGEIVGLIHGKENVEKARESFDKAFSKGEVPDEMQIIKVKRGTTLKEALVSSGTVASGGALERLIEGNAVKYAGTDEVIKDKFIKVEDLKNDKLKIGKKDFRQIVIE